MKVLLASITAGQGHHATAAAVGAEMERRGAQVKTVDMFRYINRFLYKAVDKGYLLSSKYIPGSFGKAYHFLETDSLLRKSMIAFLTSELISDKIFGHVQSFNPDVVLSTHPFAAQIIDELADQRVLRAKHVGIITDYAIHPLWECMRHIDGVVICSELMTFRALQRGLDADRLLPFGIPVNPKYERCVEKAEARRQLALDADRATVLIMSGSMGFGNMADTVDKLAQSGLDVQMICVCGRNEKTFELLSRRTFSIPTLVLGYVDNIELCMDAADIIVTKPGGLTVSEALAKRKPLVLSSPIPGQEEDNEAYLLNYGLAMHATKTMPVHELIYVLLTHPERVALMREAMDLFVAGQANKTLCDHLYKIVGQEEPAAPRGPVSPGTRWDGVCPG